MTKTKTKVRASVVISKGALIKEYEKSYYLKMPKDSEYAGYTFFIPKSYTKEIKVSDENGGVEEYFDLSLPPKSVITIKNKDGKEEYLSYEELKDEVQNKDASHYEKQENKAPRWLSFDFNLNDMVRDENDYSVFRISSGEYSGYTYILSHKFIKQIDYENQKISCFLPYDYKVKISNRKEETSKELTSSEIYGIYKESKKEKTYEIKVPQEALVKEKDEFYIFKMPNGTYEDYTYIVSKKYVKANEGIFDITLTKNNNIYLKNKYIRGAMAEKIDLDTYEKELKDKGNEDYTKYAGPSEIKRKTFESYEKLLDKNIPHEMKEKNKWVCVKVYENKDTGRYEKFLISPVDGNFARIDDESTFVSYEEAKKYGKENGCVTLAYALNGEDKIACLDLDKCINDKGEISSEAKEFLDASGGTYTEKSVSGHGYHIFFNSQSLNKEYKTFSKSGVCELYKNSHFISVTGNTGKDESEIKDIDKAGLKELIDKNFDIRMPWKGEMKGESGLTYLSDHELIKKASESKGGKDFMALYSGVDLKNNHSNSDMALMVRLAYYSNNDMNQMLRIFATSGLYREKKSKEYYEGTALKAIRMTPDTYKGSYRKEKENVKKKNNVKTEERSKYE